MAAVGQAVPLSQETQGTLQPGQGLQAWKERRTQAASARKRYEPTWHLCQAFVANRQWVGWDKRNRRVVDEPNPANRERHTVNVLTQYLMTNVGKLASDDLRPTFYAGNDSIEARDFAKQVNRALEFAWEEEIDADNALYDAIIKLCVFGTSAVQCVWDSSSGPELAQNIPFQNGSPILDPTQARTAMADAYGSGGLELRNVRGRLAWHVYSPFNILPPPALEHPHQFPWLITERAVPLDQLQMTYPQAGKLQEQNLAAVDMLGYRDLASETASDQEAIGKLKGHVIVSSGYEMPNVKYPQGRTVTWSQNVLLSETSSLPYSLNGEPHIGIRFFRYVPVPGRFWAVGTIEPGLGPQRQRNRSRSQYIELKDRAGLGRVYARPGSMKVTQLPGGKVMEVIEVADGRDFPQEIAGLGPGPWMAQDIAMHDTDLDKVMGMREVTMGAAPGGISAYSAMALLAEQDDRRIGPILKQMRSEVSWLCRYTLETMRRYWPPNKQILLAGDDQKIEAFIFNAAKVPASYLVKVGQGAPAPRSQAGEIQKTFDLFDRSISSGRPLPLSWLYESLQEGKPQPLPTDYADIQRDKAEIENMAMGRGVVIQPSPLDDHAIHIAEHKAALAAHQLIPGMEKELMVMLQHIQAHGAMMQQQAMAAQVPGLQGGMGQMGGAPTMGAPTPSPAPGLPPQR